MNAAYDPIAPEYRKCKQQPWRTHIERHTMMELIGDVSGQTVLDLACGEGYYARLLASSGAASVTGVDISENMIRLALRQEEQVPLGIKYLVHDASTLALGARFDLVVGSYLLCNARNENELLAMCTAVARSLRPGGRFIAVNNNTEQAPIHFPAMEKYGFIKSVPGEVIDGTPLMVEFLMDDRAFTLINYCFSRGTYARALYHAGLRDLRWQRLRLSPEAEDRRDYWEAFLEHPPIQFLECRK